MESDSHLLNPNALTRADLAKLLTKISKYTITETMILADCNNGAPVNADGTLHLVYYVAWLVREACNEE